MSSVINDGRTISDISNYTLLSSKTINVANNEQSYSNAYSFKGDVYYVGNNVETNKSVIYVEFSSYGRYGYFSGFGNQKINVYLNTSATSTTTTVIENKTVGSIYNKVWSVMGSWQGEVEHNADGTLNIEVLFDYVSGSTTSFVVDHGTHRVNSGNVSLETIPRATTNPSGINFIGNNTKNVTPAVSTFKHKYTLELGTWSYTTPDFVGKTFDVEVPVSVASQAPDETGLSGTQRLTTYSSAGVLIGQNEGPAILALTGSYATPKIEVVTADDDNPTTQALTNEWKTLVKNASNVLITADGYMRAYGTIKRVLINDINVPFSITQVGDEQFFYATYTINKINATSVKVKVEGSRGINTEETFSYVSLGNELVEYFNPYINANIKRLGQTTGKVGVNYSGKIFKGTFGSSGTQENTLTVQYKVTQGETVSAWTNLATTLNADGTFGNASEYLEITNPLDTETGLFNYQLQYTLEMKVVDLLNTSYSGSKIITMGIPIWQRSKDKVKFNVDIYDKNNLLVENGWNAKAILTGDNLNNYTARGTYYARTNAIAGSLINSPTTQAFSLRVYYTTTGGVIQEIVDYTAQIRCTRYLYNSNWGAWKTDVIGLPKQGMVTCTHQITLNVGDKVPFNAQYYDEDFMTLNSDGTITINESGRYKIGGQFWVGKGTATHSWFYLVANGSARITEGYYPCGTDYSVFNITPRPVTLSAGDVISVTHISAIPTGGTIIINKYRTGSIATSYLTIERIR